MKKKRFLAVMALSVVFGTQLVSAQTHNIQVDLKKIGSPIQKTMYGIFFEDINYGADGGLYAEMVKNRSFEFPQSLLGWTTFGYVEVRTDGAPFPNNPHYVRLSYPGHDAKQTGLDNEGFLGVGVKQDAEYRFSVWARSAQDGTTSIRIEFIDPESIVFTTQKLTIDSKE